MIKNLFKKKFQLVLNEIKNLIISIINNFQRLIIKLISVNYKINK